MVLDSPLECKPGECYIYSDLGAITLGMMVERVTGQGLDVFLHERVFAPLGMVNTFFRPADSLKSRVAPTEVSPPRGYPLQGEVHDENAYALGGVAGHAGLFSTASDLVDLRADDPRRRRVQGRPHRRAIPRSSSSPRARPVAGRWGGQWRIGQWGSGRFMSEGSFGHVGYTGTSLWIDPDREMFVILLTNRVHAARARQPAKVDRRCARRSHGCRGSRGDGRSRRRPSRCRRPSARMPRKDGIAAIATRAGTRTIRAHERTLAHQDEGEVREQVEHARRPRPSPRRRRSKRPASRACPARLGE